MRLDPAVLHATSETRTEHRVDVYRGEGPWLIWRTFDCLDAALAAATAEGIRLAGLAVPYGLRLVSRTVSVEGSSWS